MKYYVVNWLKYLIYRFKIGLYTLANKRMFFPSLCTNSLCVNTSSLSYFTLSANTIIIIDGSDGQYFFREVAKHQRKNDYFSQKIKCFMQLSLKGVAKVNYGGRFPCQTIFSEAYVSKFQRWIDEKMRFANNIIKLSKCDYVLRRENYSIWNGGAIDNQILEEIGLGGLFSDFPEIAPLFLSYMSGTAYCYRINWLNTWETFYAQRSIATFKLAKELGVESLITEATPICLKTEKETILGVLSPKAKGTRAQDNKNYIQPLVQRDLGILWVLDLLCCQTDHAPNNYNLIMNNDGKETICAFDNDNMFTFFPLFYIKRFKAQFCSCLITKDGMISLPYLDKRFAERIINVNIEQITTELNTYLNKLQLIALRIRFYKLRKALIKTNKIRPNFLLNDNDWNSNTLKEEINGEYGITYLKLLLEYHQGKH